jgi:hypothetical protein
MIQQAGKMLALRERVEPSLLMLISSLSPADIFLPF